MNSDAWAAAVAGVSPAALRNAEPILGVLRDLFAPALPAGGLVLEIAAGGGYHAGVFARGLPQYRWQPTEMDARGCVQMEALVAAAELPNLAPPTVLDVMADPWPFDRSDAIVCINMIHISPWAATTALFAGAGRILPEGGLLVTYGPYLIAGDFQAESNRAFDQSLRARNPSWGLREIADITRAANTAGFDHMATTPMPANNHVLAFRKRG